MKNIAIFASGSGTNAENIMKYFKSHPDIMVRVVASNKPDAKVLERAQNNGIEHFTFKRPDFYESDRVLRKLSDLKVDFIVLAGFLWLVPSSLVTAYPDRIVNIHPALLPKYGGKGMYGSRVHAAVIENGEQESGISIHYVNERYDEGNIIFQARCPVRADDTPDSLAARIHKLEYEHFPRVIEECVQSV